ncbi:Uncharacterized protein DAT39_013636, partial [Clarias magur]
MNPVKPMMIYDIPRIVNRSACSCSTNPQEFGSFFLTHLGMPLTSGAFRHFLYQLT